MDKYTVINTVVKFRIDSDIDLNDYLKEFEKHFPESTMIRYAPDLMGVIITQRDNGDYNISGFAELTKIVSEPIIKMIPSAKHISTEKY